VRSRLMEGWSRLPSCVLSSGVTHLIQSRGSREEVETSKHESPRNTKAMIYDKDEKESSIHPQSGHLYCGLWMDCGHVDILVQYPILIPRYPPQDTHTASSRGRPWVSSTRTQQTCKVLTMAPWAGFASVAKRISVVMALLDTSIQTRRFFPFNGASEENRL
jgi:hypothetical protein